MAPVISASTSTPSNSAARRRLAVALLVTLLAGLVLAVHIASYRPFLADDALISLQYSQRLLQGKGLTWTGGCIPFWSQLPSIDMLGLNDYYIPRHPPASFGQGWIGHELGDGGYVLDRQPDLVLFCLPTGSADPCYVSGKQMTEHPEFYEQFSLVNFRAGEALYGKPRVLTARLWVRREGGKTGIQRTTEQITIPGYFLSSGEESASVLDGQGRWAIETHPGSPAWLRDLKVPDGSWRVEAVSNQPVRVSVYRGENKIQTGESAVISVPDKSARVDLK